MEDFGVEIEDPMQDPEELAQDPPEPAVPAAQPVVQAAVFALAPGLVAINFPIDYSTRIGASLYSAGTQSLPIKFDGEVENVSTFVDGLLARAREMGWTHPQASICTVPVTRNGQRMAYNLIEEYGRYTLEELRTHVLTYYNQATRTAQYANMMYYCILNSITEEANNRIINEQDKYVINGISSGPLVFKFLMTVVTIDTRATVTNLRMDLSNLDTYISVVQFDIDKFNLYVKEKCKQLRNRGETSQDVLVNLFKAYEMIPDAIFHNWLIRKKENYEEGADMNPDSLMLDALNRYQSLKREGKWQSTTPESQKIVALTAQVHEMQKMLKGTNFKLSSQKSTSKNKFSKNAKDKRKSSKPMKKRNNDEDAWKKIPPSNNDPKKKIVKGKEFHWCDEHMAWGRHKPDDCHLKQQRMNAQTSTNVSNNEQVSNATVFAPEDQENILASLAMILKE